MYAWSHALAFPYETAWSILQKLTLLNQAKSLTFLRAICTTHISVHQNYPDSCHSKTFIDTEWVAVGARRYAGLPPITAAGMALQGELLRHGGQAYLGSLAKRLLTCELRVCPECISLGFHCIAHQVEGIHCCPIHHVELIRNCPSCGKSLLTFEPCAWFNSFKCPSCKKRLIQEKIPRPPGDEFREQVNSRIGPLIAWLHSFQNEIIAWPATPTDLPLRTTQEWPCDSVTFRGGVLWALHLHRAYGGGTQSFGSMPCGFRLVSLGTSSDKDVWGPMFRDLSRADMYKRVEEMRSFVIAVIKEERSTILGMAKEIGECCECMGGLLHSLDSDHDSDFLSLGGRLLRIWAHVLPLGGSLETRAGGSKGICSFWLVAYDGCELS